MADRDAFRALRSQISPRALRWALPAATFIYPCWYWVSPAGPNNPIAGWFAVGFMFFTTALSSWSSIRPSYSQILFYSCLWSVTLHFFALAHFNDMHPFFSIGSSLSVIVHSVLFRSRRAFASYATFVLAISILSYALDPDMRKIAYWMSLTLVLGFSYHSLSIQLSALHVIRKQHSILESAVAARTKLLSEQSIQLSNANQNLIQEINEREKLQDQLKLSQAMETAGRLAGGVAHEFNNLLAVIYGYTEQASTHIADSRAVQESLNGIVSASEKSSILIRKLLAFGKQESHGLEAFDLNKLIMELDPTLRLLMGEANEIVVRLCDRACILFADTLQIEQIVINLCINARDAMPSGGTLVIQTEIDDHIDMENGRVLLTIRDSGSGMSEDVRQQVFDPFFTTKSDDQGTGLGLSIVYTITKSLGGNIELSSRPGKGTKVKVDFPLSDRSPTVETYPDDEILVGTERILFVEDNHELGKLTEKSLKALGYHVILSSDPRKVFRENDLQQFDILISDVVMPKISGIELAEQANKLNPEIKIILISGYIKDRSAISRNLDNNVSILSKPFRVSELARLIRKVSGHRES